jgi:hypothetical protein
MNIFIKIIILVYTIHRKKFGSNWFMDEKNLNKDQGICR